MRIWLFGLIFICAFNANAGDSTVSANSVKTPELTIENLKIVLQQEKVKHADVVLQQAIVETGWFKCTHCSLSRNNIFGFYYILFEFITINFLYNIFALHFRK